MRISFINPTDSPILNMGLAYVITAVEKAGHTAGLINMAFVFRSHLKYILTQIEQQNPDILGFSTMTSTHEKSLRIAERVRKQFSDLPMIWGGTHSTLLPEETIQHPLVDAICIGEGEISLPEYLDKLENHEEPRVKGIW